MSLGFGDDGGQGLKGRVDTARLSLLVPLSVLNLMGLCRSSEKVLGV